MSRKNRIKREEKARIKAELINQARPENVQLAASLADGIIWITEKYEKFAGFIFIDIPKFFKNIFKKNKKRY